ncbi:MAG: NAD(P)H-hydrate dehydratase [Oscillospiraceae bacterium]
MKTEILNQEAVAAWLPDRDPWGHKGDFGKLLLLCGSVGYTGAAALAARAAVRSGAGLVLLGVPEPVYTIEAVKLDEPVVFPLAAEGDGLSPAAVPEILRRLAGCDACLVGPGLGRLPGVRAVTEAVLREARCPVVLDADGLNVLEGAADALKARRAPTVLTPHDGEFRRLGGAVGPDRMASAAALAQTLGAVVLLKGHRTVVTDGTRGYENRTGNPGMATGGSGDVLAGLLVSLLGQGLPPLEAAACAAWVHGAAGDLCAGAWGQYGLTPSDMVEALPRFLK